MKKLYLIFIAMLFASASFAQGVFCNPTGNLMLFTNYDGGNLNIDVDVNIPNLKIGVVAYEGTNIVISGTYANNVVAVAYAGMNGSNAHCDSLISTSITGIPITALDTIIFAPPATLANTNGNNSIICGYSCSTTTNQGGCNTVDQIEAYFLSMFTGSLLYAHLVQYGCWTGNQTLSYGGTCCAVTTGLTSTMQTDQINISPNPASSSLLVKVSNSKASQLQITNILGEEVLNKQLQENDNTIDISALPDGIYLAGITGENLNTMKKFIIQH
jgi:hypothetical protein